MHDDTTPQRSARFSRFSHRLLITVGTAAVAAASAVGCSKPPPLVTMPDRKPAAVVFANVGVLDVERGVVTPAQDVVVSGENIAAIGATGTLTLPADAERIDGKGATLLPGYIDSHGHVGNGSAPPWVGAFPDADRNLQAYLYCGVTTVLDPADLEPDAFERRDAINSGKLIGPTIYASGPMLTAVGGHPLPVLEELAPWWIRWYVERHAVRPLATDADVQKAIDGLAAQHADIIKMAIDSIPAATIASFGKPVVATMGVFESYALTGRGPRVPTPLERETVDAATLASFDKIPEGAVSPAFQAFFDQLFATHLAWRTSIRLMRADGVTILAGSDSQSGVFPGAGLHREFALLAESGMTAAEVVRAATLDAARFLDKSDDPTFGIVAVGKRADLVLIDGNPTANVANLARIRMVMKRGVPLERHPVGGGA